MENRKTHLPTKESKHTNTHAPRDYEVRASRQPMSSQDECDWKFGGKSEQALKLGECAFMCTCECVRSGNCRLITDSTREERNWGAALFEDGTCTKWQTRM